MKINGTTLFKETQHFRVRWIWVIIIISSLSSVAITISLAMAGEESRKEAWIALAFVIPLESLMLYLFYIVRFETVVSSEGIFYKWWPFQKSYRFISKEEIKGTALRKGPSLSYGFHWVPGYGKVHNMGPGKGFQFVLKNGKKIFLGTQQQPAFQTALEKIVTVSQQV